MPRRFLPHLEKILVPLGKDGSSEALLNFLLCMLRALPPGIVKEVYLLHVVSSDALKKASRRDLRLEILVKETRFLQQLYQEYLEKEAEPFLAKAAERIEAEITGIEVKKVVLSGDPPKEIVKFAQEKQFGAEVIARRARSHISEWVLGSCTHALLHRPGNHSTYVVGRIFTETGSCETPKMLVCLDGSPYAWKALEEAAGVALLWRAREIVLLHVVDFLPAPEEKPEESDTMLAAAESFLREAGLETRITRKVLLGNPAEEIVKEAEEGDYDLVFLGRRGRGYLKEILLGSVSEKVVHRLVSPTLVVVNRE